MTPLILYGSDISSKNYAWSLQLGGVYRPYGYLLKQFALPPRLSLSAVGDWQTSLDGRWQARFDRLKDSQEFHGKDWLKENRALADIIVLYMMDKIQAIFADLLPNENSKNHKLPYTVPPKWLNKNGVLDRVNASKRIVALVEMLEAIKQRQTSQGHEFAFVLSLLGEKQLKASRQLRERVLAQKAKGFNEKELMSHKNVRFYAYKYQCCNIILQCFLVAFLETFEESRLKAEVAKLKALQAQILYWND